MLYRRHLLEEDSGEVVVGEVDKGENKQSNKGNEEALHCFGFEGLFPDFFKKGEADVSPVENGNGEEVEDAEVEADRSKPEEGFFEADPPRLMHHLHDEEGAAKLFWRDGSREKSSEVPGDFIKDGSKERKRVGVEDHGAVCKRDS